MMWVWPTGGRTFGVGVLAAIAAAQGRPQRAGRLWRAIDDQDAVAPLGGWRRHRGDCERFIREVGVDGLAAIPEGDDRLTLEDAVQLALE